VTIIKDQIYVQIHQL